ncbi:MAG: 5'-nucleotidase, lipoprotein e(P4) family [Niabella sp.]
MKRTLLFFVTIILVSCGTSRMQTVSPSVGQLVVDGKLWSSVFQQKAAEYDALCHQAYNIARLQLDNALSQKSDKPLAVVTDIDETILDNSPYAVHQALQGKDYESKTWYEWTGKAIAIPLPGSLGFFKYAAEKGVAVFYVTNRDEVERSATLENLKKFGYPYSVNEHLILRTGPSSKENRRAAIAGKYNIVMLFGDNLADFSTLWDKKTTAERRKNIADNKELFGSKFIVLPNLDYGGWEDALYGNKYLTSAQKDSAIRANLKGY